MDDFTKHYLIAALWSSHDESTPSGGDPMDLNYSIDDIVPEAIAKATADCERFQREQAADLALAYQQYKPHPDAPTPQCSAGHDFWLTRNRHGVGFWDRDFIGQLGERLSKAAQDFGEVDLYVGDDGKLYFQ